MARALTGLLFVICVSGVRPGGSRRAGVAAPLRVPALGCEVCDFLLGGEPGFVGDAADALSLSVWIGEKRIVPDDVFRECL